MQKKLFLIAASFCFSFFAFAQRSDSVYTEIKDGRLFAVHTVRQDEQIYSIAQQYNVPAVVLGQNNDLSFYEQLEPQRKVFIPLANYNYLKTKPLAPTSYKTLYYKILPDDSYTTLSELFGIAESELRAWNNDKNLSTVQQSYIIAGWVLYQTPDLPKHKEASQQTVSSVNKGVLATGVFVKKDTIKSPPSELEKIFNYQTSNGQFIDSTSGMVVFFKPQTNVDKNLLYAFSNEIAKGRVLKVVNPSNGKFVFAKVIGSLPNTKQYQNAKIGLDGRARSILDTREVKLWCDYFLKY